MKWRIPITKKTLLWKEISGSKISLKKRKKERKEGRRSCMCVNFSVNMIELRDAQIAGKTLFLSVLWECFWKKLAFETVDWVKKIAVISVGGPYSICWRPSKEQKGREKSNLPFLLEMGQSSSPALRVHSFQVFRPGMESTSLSPLVLRPSSMMWTTLAWLVLQLASVVGILGLQNHVSKFL